MLIFSLQLYWLSFGLIGLGVWFAFSRLTRFHRGVFARHVRRTHPALQLIVLWLLGLMPIAPIVVVSYIFQWPLLVLKIWYLAALLTGVGLAIWHRSAILARIRIPHVRRRTFVLGIIMLGSLVFDYVVSLKVGAPLYGDAPVQIAKITFFQHVHLALADPYYSHHGVVDPRYSTNLLDACQALAASLLHTTAVQVWSYSYGMYRLMLWLSLFSLLWSYLGKKYRYFAYVVLALLPFVWGSYFLFADLPDRIALAWSMLLLVGIQWWLQDDSWPLLIAAAVLTATTHALFSLVTLGYLCLLIAVLWVSRTVLLRRLAPLAVCIGVLLIPVAINLYYPNHTNQDQAAFISGTISGTTPVPHHYGSVTLAELPPIPWVRMLVYALFGLYLWLVYRTRRQKLYLLTYVIALVAVVFNFNPNVLSLIGYGVIMYTAKQRAQRIAVLALVGYYGLIVYNPLFWHVAGSNIPPWVVARFQELNVFGMAAATIGLLYVVTYPLVKINRQRYSYVAVVMVCCLFIGYYAHPITNDYTIASIWDGRSILLNTERKQSLRAITALAPKLQDQVVYSNDPNVAIRVPGVVVSNVYSFNPENESPMTNIAQRARCSLRLNTTMSLSDLQAAGITRIISDPPYSLKLARLARTRPYLKPVGQSQGYIVYAVAPSHYDAKMSSCTVPFGQ